MPKTTKIIILSVAVLTMLSGVLAEECISGDLDCDGVVNIFDLVLVAHDFGRNPCPGACTDVRADATGDREVDIFDLVLVAQNFGKKAGVCGNSIIEQGEECDSQNLEGKTCQSLGFTAGTLKCNTCKFDTTECTKPQGATYPSQLLNLTNWKLTLPIGSEGSPTEIKQPQLQSYSIDPYFMVNTAGDSIQFRAHTGGVHTSGSNYPRSELREMTDNGASKASWSTGSGIHTMYIDQAITHLPVAKPHVVAGQIHDSSDDVIVIRLEGKKLFIEVGGKDGPTLDPNYTLGKRFTVNFVAAGGQIKIYYNDKPTPSYTMSKSISGCYFKVGCYTQSSCEKVSGESCSAYGEVHVYDLQVTHI